MAPDLRQQLDTWLAAGIPEWSGAKVVDLERIHGGASRQTWRATVSYVDASGTVTRGIIVRRDPEGSLIETEREIEYAAYGAFQNSSVPVPETIAIELDDAWLGAPFFVMEEIADCRTGSALASDSYGNHARKTGEQFWRILGSIAEAKPFALGLDQNMEVPARDLCWKRELDYWEGVIDEDELSPEPVVRAAIRWLRRNPPLPPERISVVHGDYRNGNFLFDEAGDVRAVLDWEMCHLGDPLEDLGWALDPLWSGDAADRPGGMIERDEGLRIWQEESGIDIDSTSLRWWEIFAAVKGLAIWTSSMKEFLDGANSEAILAISGWLVCQRHNHLLADRLSAIIQESRS